MFTLCFIPFRGLEYTGSARPLVKICLQDGYSQIWCLLMDILRSFYALYLPTSMKWG